MPIIKSYLLPHSPLLIPEIGKANHSLLTKTSTAYQNIQKELVEKNIEIIVIISPHNNPQSDHFLINCAPEMDISFQYFGYIPPKTIVKGAIHLADQIKNGFKDTSLLQSLSETSLDYGSGIPLYLLTKQNKDLRVINITPAENLDLAAHFDFAENLAKILDDSPKRIAVIASGDLSHRLMRKSPGGYSPKGTKFDNKIIEFLSHPETAIENILGLDQRLIRDASECGLKPITILLGILKNKNWTPNILAYQTDFGVGYLSLECILEENNTEEVNTDPNDKSEVI